MRRAKAGRHPGSLRSPGHRLLRVDGPQPDAGRGPGPYPIVSKLIERRTSPTCRGFSMFGMSFCYVIFEEGTDIYWARSRVMEYLNGLRGTLPRACLPPSGRTPRGLVGCSSTRSSTRAASTASNDLRTFQDFTLRYALGSVPGVAEVASVAATRSSIRSPSIPPGCGVWRFVERGHGGDPPIQQRRRRPDPRDVGRRVLRRGRGYITSLSFIENVTVKTSGPAGTPIP